MTRVATDQAANARLEDQQKRDRVTQDLVLRQLLSTLEGRRYVWLELADANIFSSTITFGPEGYARTAFLEGQRAKGIALLGRVMRVNPQAYVTMTQENQPKELEDDGRSDADPSA